MEYDQREDLYKVRKQMAESVIRREFLMKAWVDWCGKYDDSFIGLPDRRFTNGFNAGWDALMAEIKPLVANVLTFGEIKRALIPARVRHLEAVERLRALVREGE